MTAPPVLTPISETSLVILPSTGSTTDVNTYVPFKIYSDPTSALYSTLFLTGAAEQVTYVFRKLGGDVLDIELVPGSVYTAYEEAVLEYSYIVNLYQAKNALPSLLGSSTSSFDENGTVVSGSHVESKFPRWNFAYAQRVSNYVAYMAGAGGDHTIYSASFDIVENQQDYDLQTIISSSSALSSSLGFYGKVGNKKIVVHKVFYKTPSAVWRFFGIYGGLNVAGNLMNYNVYNYGQYSDQTTYEVVPVWESKLQAQTYQDAIHTRCSHWSYELVNNRLRIFPIPTSLSLTPNKFWIQFSIPEEPWEEEAGKQTGVDGINNINSMPFQHLNFGSINSIGKMWIRNYALAICKEILAQIRGKFQSLPIPNNSVVLNAGELLQQAKEEKEKLKEELVKILEETSYSNVAATEAEIAENVSAVNAKHPSLIFIG